MPALLTSSQLYGWYPKPQATTSVQLGCSAAQGKRVIYTIIPAPPQPRERESSSQARVDSVRGWLLSLPLLMINLSTSTAANHSSPSAAAADQRGGIRNSSRRWVKTKTSTQWKTTWSWWNAPGWDHPKKEPETSPTTNPKKPQLTVIPLMTLYQRDGPCKGETEENILGSRKEEED